MCEIRVSNEYAFVEVKWNVLRCLYIYRRINCGSLANSIIFSKNIYDDK